MDDRDRNILLEFKERLPADVKSHLRRLIAFGSRARGDGEPDSDLDVVALVDVNDPKVEEQLKHIAYQVEWDHDFNPVISLKVFSESHFQDYFNRGFSFYKNVMREGIRI